MAGGIFKMHREPVVVVVPQGFDGKSLACHWLFCYGGLIPGDYPLENGMTVRIPEAYCGTEATAHSGVTLEVTQWLGERATSR